MTVEELMKIINDNEERGAKVKLANSLGVSVATAGRWVNGTQRPTEQYIRKIAQLTGLKEDDIREAFEKAQEQIKEKEEPYKPQPGEFVQSFTATPLTAKNTVQLPILADVPAGLPEYSDRDVEIFKDIPRDMFPGADFVIRCIGDSLSPKFEIGDFCVIRKTTEPIHGRPMLVETETGYCMKVIKKTENGVQLCSINKKYKPFFPKSLRVIGLIIGLWARTDKENLLELV